MARYTYTIPRNTKGEGRILMIFTKKSVLEDLKISKMKKKEESEWLNF